jgi:hypothetical protein
MEENITENIEETVTDSNENIVEELIPDAQPMMSVIDCNSGQSYRVPVQQYEESHNLEDGLISEDLEAEPEDSE